MANANGHGGARPGAGRPAKENKHADAIAAAEETIRDRLPELVDLQLQLAVGGHEMVSETWEPAGSITVHRTVIGENGKTVVQEDLAFPDLPPKQLVLVKRVVSRAAPSRQAGQYLINRITGTPVQQIKDVDAEDKISAYGQLIRELWADRGLSSGDGGNDDDEDESNQQL